MQLKSYHVLRDSSFRVSIIGMRRLLQVALHRTYGSLCRILEGVFRAYKGFREVVYKDVEGPLKGAVYGDV